MEADNTEARSWNFPCYFCIFWHWHAAKCRNNTENSKQWIGVDLTSTRFCPAVLKGIWCGIFHVNPIFHATSVVWNLGLGWEIQPNPQSQCGHFFSLAEALTALISTIGGAFLDLHFTFDTMSVVLNVKWTWKCKTTIFSTTHHLRPVSWQTLCL